MGQKKVTKPLNQKMLREVIELIADNLGLNPEGITAESKLAALDPESLDWMEVIMKMQEKWHINLPDDELQKAENIGQLTLLVMKQTETAPDLVS